MKYRVKTNYLEHFERGQIINPITPQEKGLREIIERNPMWFEPVKEVKEGQYWKSNCSDHVYRVNKVSNRQVYHRDISNKDALGDRNWTQSEFVKDHNLLSDKEAGRAIVEEAKRRGYKNDIKVIPVGSNKPHVLRCGFIGRHLPINDAIHFGGAEIYKEGKWAEIINGNWDIYHMGTENIDNEWGVKKEDVKYIESVGGEEITKDEAEAIVKALNELEQEVA